MNRATGIPLLRRLHALVRFARFVLLRIASPLDRAALLLNGKGDLPPIQLRRQSGPLRAFEPAAAEYVGLLSALAGFGPTSRILDVGCGAGAMAIMLRDRVPPDGRYLGFDVDEACIRWCKGHLRDDRFDFAHHDYFNATYRPSGERFKEWPVAGNGADIVILKSLFTHMLPPDVRFYVSELGRVLAPGGTGLVTAFTYTSVDGAVEEWFRHQGDGFRYARSGAPESAVAYPRDWLLSLFADHDLVVDFRPGYWRPQDGSTLAYQDVLMVRHRTERPAEPAQVH